MRVRERPSYQNPDGFKMIVFQEKLQQMAADQPRSTNNGSGFIHHFL
jgi:hypothetical protein